MSYPHQLHRLSRPRMRVAHLLATDKGSPFAPSRCLTTTVGGSARIRGVISTHSDCVLNRYINERFNGTNGRFRRALRAIHSRAGPIAPELRGSEGEDCHWLPQWMYVGRGDLAEHMMSCSHVLRVERLEADLLVTAAQYPNHGNLLHPWVISRFFLVCPLILNTNFFLFGGPLF